MSPTNLFSPLQLGKMHLEHRIVMAPMTRLRADERHVQLPMAAEYYSQRASRGGMMIAEATVVSPEHDGAAHMPGIWTEEQVARWREITDAVHAKGAFVFCQLIALGRVADTGLLRSEGLHRVVSSSPVPLGKESGTPSPHALTVDEIRRTASSFAAAATNAMRAGFDGAEIHGASGYLVDQFLQDTCNRRDDEFGGSVPNRARFVLEVTQAVVKAVGNDRVGLRISPFSNFQGMGMADPVPQFSHLVKVLRDLRLAYLHVIESRVNNNVDCEKTQSIEPFLDIWGKTSPVLVAGGFQPDTAAQAVRTEYKNNDTAVVFGRLFLANPDLPFRIRHDSKLNRYDRSTFYSPMEIRGYTDYSFSREYREGILQ